MTPFPQLGSHKHVAPQNVPAAQGGLGGALGGGVTVSHCSPMSVFTTPSPQRSQQSPSKLVLLGLKPWQPTGQQPSRAGATSLNKVLGDGLNSAPQAAMGAPVESRQVSSVRPDSLVSPLVQSSGVFAEFSPMSGSQRPFPATQQLPQFPP